MPLAFLAGIVVASTTGLLFRWTEGFNLCEHEIVREFPSPKGDRVAMVILSGCGATTPFATSVAVKRVGESFDFDSYDAYLFIVRDKNNIEVEWDDSKAGPTIVYDRPSRINRQVVMTRMQPISYRQRQTND